MQGSGVFLFPPTFLPCHCVSDSSLSVAYHLCGSWSACRSSCCSTFVSGWLITVNLCGLLFWSAFSTLSSCLQALLQLCRVFSRLICRFSLSFGFYPCPWVYASNPSLFTLLVVVCSYLLARLIQLSPSYTASACHRQRILSLFHFPASFGDTVPILLSAPSVFFCGVSLFLTGTLLLSYISLSFACLSGGFFTRGSICPLRLSAICLGSIILLPGFLIPLGLSLRFLFFRSSVFLSGAFIFYHLFIPWWSPPGFFSACLPSVLSRQSPCAVLSFSSYVGFFGSPSLSTPFL